MDDQYTFSKNNSISLIKTIAAIQVMTGHIFFHLKLSVPNTLSIIHGFINGVPVFFALSGYLIWFSIKRSNSFGAYCKKRFWRIYPELWVAVLIEIISICIFYNGWNTKDLSIFTITQATVFQFYKPVSLDEYGCGVPNGTLWTIYIMIQFYLLAYPFYKLMHGKRMFIWIIGFIISTGGALLGQFACDKIGIHAISVYYGRTIFPYFWLFYIGVFCAEFCTKLIPLLKRYWFVPLLLGIAFYYTHFDLQIGNYYVMWSLFLGAGLIGFSYAYPKLKIKNDISYGVFLYHMIFVNIFIENNMIENWWYAVAVVMLTGLFAFISYKTIGIWSSSKKCIKST